MKAKKIIALILALVMCLGLVSCASSTDDSTDGTNNTGSTSSTNSGSSSSDEPYRVRLTLATMMTIPAESETQRVEDAINDYIHNTLGISEYELDLELVSISDYTTTVSMALASGEKYDIIMALDLSTFVTNGYMSDLTGYADNELAGALSVLPENWIRCGTVDGNIYAVPCYKGQVLSWKYIYDEDVYGDVDGIEDVSSLEELDAIMPALKAAAPDEYPYVYANQNVNLEYFEDHVSAVGTYAATVGDSTTLVNIFSTDAFKRGVEMAYRWSQAGYTDPEGSTNTLSHDAIVMAGQSKGVMMGHAYSIDTIEQMFTMNNTYGGTFKAVEIGISDMSTNTLVWGVANTSKNVSAAASMISLIWTDEYIMSTLIYGIEGVSWEWANDEHTSIAYPEGLDINTVPYTCLYSCGIFGNQFNLYGFDGNTSEDDKTFMKELIDNAWYPPLFGFTPSSENVATQVAAVSNVYNQYYDVLTYGDVDPDVYLPKFLQELEDAGINDIIADYQAQVDEWLKTID
jgi:putative aldouronate transport system substrate-binding protein